MMVTGFLRVLASGVLLLLVTTAAFVQRADATTSDGTGTDEDCSADYSACQDDETCSDCLTVIGETNTEFNDCKTEVIGGDFDSSTARCAVTTAFYCCVDAASGNDCVANAAFVDYANCQIAFAGCTVAEELTCDDIAESTNESDGATSSLRDASTVIAFSCACIFFLPLIMV